MLGGLLKALFNFVCGSSESKPQQPPTPPQKPSKQYYHQQQQPHYSGPQAAKPSQQQEPQYHKPLPAKPAHPHAVQHESHKPTSPKLPFNKDQNLINQQDPYYVSLRDRANQEGDAMAKCFEESQQAYKRGDGALAKELSIKGKQHQRQMEQLNNKASEWIFAENNKDSQPHEVDLHGLYVKEAITYTDRALQQARARGDKEIHLIVGKGLHSKNGAAKLKPAMEELIQKYKLSAQADPTNGGVLVVELDSAPGRGVGADELTRRIVRSDDGCIVM